MTFKKLQETAGKVGEKVSSKKVAGIKMVDIKRDMD
jgi:hypothetical protein